MQPKENQLQIVGGISEDCLFLGLIRIIKLFFLSSSRLLSNSLITFTTIFMQGIVMIRNRFWAKNIKSKWKKNSKSWYEKLWFRLDVSTIWTIFMCWKKWRKFFFLEFTVTCTYLIFKSKFLTCWLKVKFNWLSIL